MREINHSKIKETNRKKIIRLLQEEEEITKLDISRRLGISITTVSTNIIELKEEEVVGDIRSLESTGGRKAMAIKLNENYRFSLGVAITPEQIKISLLNLKKKVVDRTIIDHNNDGIENIIELTKKSIEELLNRQRIGNEKLLGIGVSIPGTVDSEKGIIRYCYFLGIKDFNIKEKFEYMKVPVYVDNEANLSAFYEFLNKHSNNENLLYISITDGLGLGIIINGRIYRGSNNTSGKMGHMKININGAKCKCGSKGCLEAYTSKNVLIDSYNNLSPQKIKSVEEFESLYLNGDSKAVKVLKEYIEILAIGISNLIMLLDPSTVILGGEINTLLEAELKYLSKEIYKENLFTNSQNCKVKIADDIDSYLLGAAMIHIEKFLEID